MKSPIIVAILASSLVGIPIMAGCDRTVSEKKVETTGPNGASKTEEKTVQHPDGSVTTTAEKKSNSNP